MILSFIYIFVIKNYLNNNKLKEIVLLVIISDDILNLDNKGLNLGIWKIIERYNKNYHILRTRYKSYNTIMQLFNILKITIFVALSMKF